VKIAHVSDLHLLDLEGAVPMRLFNKRITGYMNLRFHRKSVHKLFAVEASLRELRKIGVDHVVITGDVSNLALEREFELVRTVLDRELGLSPDQVSMVPGNHDTYTQGSFRTKRFATKFASCMTSDLVVADGPFPYVRLRGPVALIGLSTAVPRLPLVAAGEFGRKQLDALAQLLKHPEVRSRTPVILQHHPWHNPPEQMRRLLEGLYDAEAEADLLQHVEQGLLLHGHLHRRVRRTLRTSAGHIDAVGATSASLLHEREDRMAGFNVYEIDGNGAIRDISSRRYHTEQATFEDVAIPTQ
jgi:3',5'-cyclic AMP phosphodiesterase CpdA